MAATNSANPDLPQQTGEPKKDRDDDHGTAAQREDVALARSWGARTPDLLHKRCLELGAHVHTVEGLVPCQSLGLWVGDSGLGKSPLLYLMAVCIASGREFLGRPVRQGRVLYMDFENSVEEVAQTIDNIRCFLGIDRLPTDLRLWNFNDAPEKWGKEGHRLPDLVKACQPSVVIVDPLSALYPGAEEKNSEANKALFEIRDIMKSQRCAFEISHHIKKPGEDGRVSLEVVGVKDWLKQARGASSLVNGVDIRIALDYPLSFGSRSGDSGEMAIVFEGYGRLRTGTIPRTYLARVLDDDGQPIGYKAVEATPTIDNAEQMTTFLTLPDSFRHKIARLRYGKGGQATTDFLQKFIRAKMLEKKGNLYVKTDKGKSSRPNAGD
jgi:hypothetical protein